MFHSVEASMSDASFEERIAYAARFWETVPTERRIFGPEDLARRFEKLPADATHHHVPTSFSLSDDFSFMPVLWDMRWSALEESIAAWKPRAAAMYLPFHWQSDPVFMAAMHRTGTLGTTIIPGNVALAHEMLRKMGAELVVATFDTAQALLSTLDAVTSLPVKVWQIVVTPEDVHRKAVFPGSVFKDLHATPVHSVAWQCAYLSGAEFHPSPVYAWQVEADEVIITSLSDVPAPLFRHRFAAGRLVRRECACGRQHILTII